MKQFVLIMILGLMSQLVQAEEATTEPTQPDAGQVIDNRQERQEARIQKGIEKGSLTEAEAKKLAHQQKRIKKMEKRAQADGEISKKEMTHIQHAQNNANRDIRRKNHNKRKN